MAKGFTKLKMHEVPILSDFMRTVLTKDEDGYAVYAPGWTDDKVYDHMRKQLTNLTLSSVQHMRMGSWGRFRPAAPPPRDPKVVEGLEQRIARLQAANAMLVQRVEKQEEEMGRLLVHFHKVAKAVVAHDAVLRPLDQSMPPLSFKDTLLNGSMLSIPA